MRVQKLSLEEIELMAHFLARELMGWDEPIPDFSTRFPNVLESCLETPFQSFSNKTFYKGLTGKGAVLFYLLIKNHPFQNGNKRIAVTSLFVLLYKNKKWINVEWEELYRIAVFVAKSEPQESDIVIGALKKFLEDNLTTSNNK
jgi:death-on-curing family protein